MKLHSGNKYKALGIMSGTSLDGIDLAAVEFEWKNNHWDFKMHAAQTLSYDNEWFKKLQSAPTLPGEKLIALHQEYGRFTGAQCVRFIQETGFVPNLIASHGHTVFHRPDLHYTFQLGCGAAIAATTTITTIADFRTGDVALGGQGAPLVPVGDQLLFSEFDYCLNLGGFGNISYDNQGRRTAFDTCPVNFVLNSFAEKQGLAYDKNGDLGRRGKVNASLLERLNALPYYHQTAPKSLGREWVETEFLPLLLDSSLAEQDKMRTVYEHIALQIGRAAGDSGKMLVTGGGAFNTFLLERIKHFAQAEIVVPAPEIINFKEALIFGFLGVLKFRGDTNCLATVTGAASDSSSGVVFG